MGERGGWVVPVMARERGGIVYHSVLQGVRDIFLVSTPESPGIS